jgi:hypothetical protein
VHLAAVWRDVDDGVDLFTVLPTTHPATRGRPQEPLWRLDAYEPQLSLLRQERGDFHGQLIADRVATFPV